MKNLEHAFAYVGNAQSELIQLIKDLCAIPSFSHHEEKKAQFIKEWFLQLILSNLQKKLRTII